MPDGILTVTLSLVTILNVLGIVASYWLLLRRPKNWKIQDRSYSVETLNERMPLILCNLSLIYLSTWAGLSVLEPYIPFESIEWWNLLLQVFAISLIDDALFYFYHRWLHLNKWAYKNIHKIHHKAFTPVPMEYLYVHPAEWALGVIAPVVGMLCVALATGGTLNAWVFLLYSLYRTLHELDVHSGLKSPIGRYIPFFGVTEHHDMHHAKPNCGNYSATYVIWDRIMGTEAKG